MTIRRADIAFFFAMLLGLYVAWLARDVLLLVYTSALFAVVVTPAINTVRRIRIGSWHPGRGLAVLLIVVCGIGGMGLFASFALPPIFRDLSSLGADWPHRSAMLIERLHKLPFMERVDATTLQQQLAGAVGDIVGVFRQVAGGLFWFFSWLILTAYFIADGERAFHWFLSLFPQHHRDRLRPTLMRAEARVRHWLVGQAALMLILGVTSGVVLGLLKIKYFYALALFAGMANIVPIIGPLASVALASVVAGFDSWTKLAGVLGFYFIYQQIENAFLTPKIMKSTVDLPPLAVIIALSLGGALAGILGALIAVPTAALVAVLIDEYLVKPHSERAAESAQADAAAH
jgi:predicted PurR-regulated permease PerM